MAWIKDFKHFEEVNNAGEVVVIDAYFEWCQPCKVYKPFFTEYGDEHQEEYNFYFVELEEDPELANYFDAKSAPITIVFKGGKEVARTKGFMYKEDLDAFIKDSIK